jgi:hypothetical protein
MEILTLFPVQERAPARRTKETEASVEVSVCSSIDTKGYNSYIQSHHGCNDAKLAALSNAIKKSYSHNGSIICISTGDFLHKDF